MISLTNYIYEKLSSEQQKELLSLVDDSNFNNILKKDPKHKNIKTPPFKILSKKILTIYIILV